MKKDPLLSISKVQRGDGCLEKEQSENGVNFGHYHILKNVHKVPKHQMLKRLIGLGVDDYFSKEELELTGQV